MHIEKTNKLQDLLLNISQKAEKLIEESEDKEEIAFLIGNMNMCATLSNVLEQIDKGKTSITAPVSLNYATVKRMYNKAHEDYNVIEGQVNIEDIIENIEEIAKFLKTKKNKKDKE